jgi:uncharacterized protein YqgC (DUF456 family)
VHAARILGNVAADRARDLARRIRRVVEAERRDMLRDARFVTPGCTRAVRASGSTETMRLNFASEMRTPSASGSAPPESPVPDPRATTGVFVSRAASSTAATSASLAGIVATSGVSRYAERPSHSYGRRSSRATSTDSGASERLKSSASRARLASRSGISRTALIIEESFPRRRESNPDYSMEPQIYFVIAAILVLLGLAGTILPVLPGVLLVFGGLFLAAWADGFQHVGIVALSIIGTLAALSFVTDFVATLLGAKRVGASPLALLGAAIGGIVGIFLGIPGLIFGPFIGAVSGNTSRAGAWLRRARWDWERGSA